MIMLSSVIRNKTQRKHRHERQRGTATRPAVGDTSHSHPLTTMFCAIVCLSTRTGTTALFYDHNLARDSYTRFGAQLGQPRRATFELDASPSPPCARSSTRTRCSASLAACSATLSISAS